LKLHPIERDPVSPGQESVWDYPRPPRVEPVEARLVVRFGAELVADTTHGLRVIETASPPCFYFPPADVRTGVLRSSGYETVCEWKGRAEHFDLVVGSRISARAAWSYRHPNAGYESIAGYIAFYPGRVDEASVGGERVIAQPGGYYGGWITANIKGPFKGDPGTGGW
jgi:uncharacterized protein (DUF427 family)